MQFFLTLLASIASLSAYTLVGVHALTACTTCPSSVAGQALVSRCVDSKSITYCQYNVNRFLKKPTFCNYDVCTRTMESYLPNRRGPRAHPTKRKILRAVLRASLRFSTCPDSMAVTWDGTYAQLELDSNPPTSANDGHFFGSKRKSENDQCTDWDEEEDDHREPDSSCFDNNTTQVQRPESVGSNRTLCLPIVCVIARAAPNPRAWMVTNKIRRNLRTLQRGQSGGDEAQGALGKIRNPLFDRGNGHFLRKVRWVKALFFYTGSHNVIGMGACGINPFGAGAPTRPATKVCLKKEGGDEYDKCRDDGDECTVDASTELTG
ncbi:hypothetical protein BDN67DRAFT_981380 [Paxillus ammoniavirescens]|nr:hypothetical protein BDN67DRAFT_981380 [Paxillus ammoniavirescens]